MNTWSDISKNKAEFWTVSDRQLVHGHVDACFQMRWKVWLKAFIKQIPSFIITKLSPSVRVIFPWCLIPGFQLGIEKLDVAQSLCRGEIQFSSVQSLSHVWLFVTPWIPARQASLSITNSQSLLKLMSIDSVMPSSHLILCHPLLLLPPSPPSIRVFSNESTLPMRWPKHWPSHEFQLQHQSFQWTPRTDLP